MEGGRWLVYLHPLISPLSTQTADCRLETELQRTQHPHYHHHLPLPAASLQHYLQRCTEEGGGRTSKLWTDSTYPLGATDGHGAVVNCKIIQYFLRVSHNSGGRGEIWSNVQTWNAEERNCEYECWICTVSRLGLLFTAPITHLLAATH